MQIGIESSICIMRLQMMEVVISILEAVAPKLNAKMILEEKME